jgi:hypothetical protein
LADITLTQGNVFQDVTGYSTVTTGAMGGCVSIIVIGLNGVRAQHCSGGFAALDPRVRLVGPITAIIIAAAHFSGGADFVRVQRWVAQHRGPAARTHCAIGGNVRVDIQRAALGWDLPSCITIL